MRFVTNLVVLFLSLKIEIQVALFKLFKYLGIYTHINIHVYAYICMQQQLVRKEAMNLKEIEEVYMGGRKGRGEI